MTEPALAQRETIAANIIKFTQDNGLQIHPGQNPFTWADLVLKKGGCPCVPGRSCCPCDNTLILRPRGAEATAVIIIEEVEPDVWRVRSAAGNYTGFARGKKRSYFETYINQWVVEAILRAAG